MSTAYFLACGGAAVGASCTKEGDESQCESGAICGKNESDVLECLKVCTTQADCAADEECNGVTGLDVKGCRPKDATSTSSSSSSSGGG
jgi:hypothetical protein